jgi:import inner membrane translocase subunit TIM21
MLRRRAFALAAEHAARCERAAAARALLIARSRAANSATTTATTTRALYRAPFATLAAPAPPPSRARGFACSARASLAPAGRDPASRASARAAAAASSESAKSARADVATTRGGTYDEITDKWIPEKPVTAVESVSYGAVALVGVGVAVGALWYGIGELLFAPPAQAAFDEALLLLERDPRIAVRVGTPMTSYGNEGRSRRGRQQLAHATEVDGHGNEWIIAQGAVRGPQGRGAVHLKARKDKESGEWVFAYVAVDVRLSGNRAERVMVVEQRQRPGIMRAVE